LNDRISYQYDKFVDPNNRSRSPGGSAMDGFGTSNIDRPHTLQIKMINKFDGNQLGNDAYVILL